MIDCFHPSVVAVQYFDIFAFPFSSELRIFSIREFFFEELLSESKLLSWYKIAGYVLTKYFIKLANRNCPNFIKRNQTRAFDYHQQTYSITKILHIATWWWQNLFFIYLFFFFSFLNSERDTKQKKVKDRYFTFHTIKKKTTNSTYFSRNNEKNRKVDQSTSLPKSKKTTIRKTNTNYSFQIKDKLTIKTSSFFCYKVKENIISLHTKTKEMY